MSALPSSRKTHSEKHKQIFRQLLKELPNKSCVDCKSAQHPRWASWNLGCFICIRCSGIHRSMGTHISRVKSVDLDVWTDEQVESMIKWGNEKCNIFWEAKLPENYVPDSSKIENFIRTKYDLKKWAASSRVPDPMTVSKSSSGEVATNAPLQTSVPNPIQKPVQRAHTTPSGSSTAPVKASSHAASASSLLDDDFGAFSSSTSSVSSPSPVPQPSFSSRTNANASPSVNRGTPGLSAGRSTPVTPTPSVAPSPKVSDVRGDLKKSILSLYSSPSSSTSSVHQAQNTQSFRSPATMSPYAQSAGPASTASPRVQSSSGVSGISNSLAGLSFGAGNESRSSTVSQSSQRTSSAASFSSSPQPPAPTPAQNYEKPVSSGSYAGNSASSWANEWNDSSSSVNQWGSTPVYNGATSNSSVLGAGFAGTFGNTSSADNVSTSTGLKSATGTGSNTNLDDDLFKNVWN